MASLQLPLRGLRDLYIKGLASSPSHFDDNDDESDSSRLQLGIACFIHDSLVSLRHLVPSSSSKEYTLPCKNWLSSNTAQTIFDDSCCVRDWICFLRPSLLRLMNCARWRTSANVGIRSGDRRCLAFLGLRLLRLCYLHVQLHVDDNQDSNSKVADDVCWQTLSQLFAMVALLVSLILREAGKRYKERHWEEWSFLVQKCHGLLGLVQMYSDTLLGLCQKKVGVLLEADLWIGIFLLKQLREEFKKGYPTQEDTSKGIVKLVVTFIQALLEEDDHNELDKLMMNAEILSAALSLYGLALLIDKADILGREHDVDPKI